MIRAMSKYSLLRIDSSLRSSKKNAHVLQNSPCLIRQTLDIIFVPKSQDVLKVKRPYKKKKKKRLIVQ